MDRLDRALFVRIADAVKRMAPCASVKSVEERRCCDFLKLGFGVACGLAAAHLESALSFKTSNLELKQR